MDLTDTKKNIVVADTKKNIVITDTKKILSLQIAKLTGFHRYDESRSTFQRHILRLMRHFF